MRLRQGFYLRLALVADLGVYLLMIMVFVLLPLYRVRATMDFEGNELTPIEVVLAILGIIPIILLGGRLFVRPKIRFNEWAYLVTGFYGLLVLAAFLTIGLSHVYVHPNQIIFVITAFFIGIIGAAGAHVFDGGREPLGPRVERLLRGTPDG